MTLLSPSISARRWALAVLASMGGCQVIGDIADVDFAEPPPFVSAAGGRGGAGGGGGEGGICPSIPARPTQPGGGDDVDVVLAMRTVEFGERDYRMLRVPTIGLDLDDATTECVDGEPAPDTEQRCSPPAIVEPAVLCDGECGIDNAMARIFSSALGLLITRNFTGDNASGVLSDDLCKGSWTMLMRVWGYDGTANDDQVNLAVYPAEPLAAESCAPTAGAGGAGGAGGAMGPSLECMDGVARWDGEDAWPVLTSGFEDAAPTSFCPLEEDMIRGLEPRYVDRNAFVADGRLVATLPQARFVLYARDLVLPFDLISSTVTGTLVEVDGQWRLEDALVAGRWPVEDIFDGMSLAKLNGDPICTTSEIYEPVKNAVCANRDMPNQIGPVVPCDALSYAFAFTASQARMGNVVQSADLVPGCTADVDDPATDSCE